MSYLNEIVLYIYYIKDKYELLYGEILPLANNVFAYTTDKKCAKMFELQRNMKLFKKEKKEVTKKEYNEFVRYMKDNGDRYLDIYKYTFYSNGEKLNKKMALSKTEKQRIDGRKMMLEINISKNCWYPPEIFNDDIYKALEVLKYNDLSKFIGSYPHRAFSTNNDKNVNTIEDVIKINDLELVIEVIGGTLEP